jgi:hypothetical protein
MGNARSFIIFLLISLISSGLVGCNKKNISPTNVNTSSNQVQPPQSEQEDKLVAKVNTPYAQTMLKVSDCYRVRNTICN